MLIYDCEIVKAIQSKKEPRVEGIEYCEGWRDFEGMGISVIGAYDYWTERYRVFTAAGNGGGFDEFRMLVDEADLVVGFNSLKFDNKLCAANAITVPDEKSYDILREMWRAAGLDPDIFNFKTHLGFGLDDTAKANFGLGKTGEGGLAPVLWQLGCYGQVIDYCLEDVRLTKRLFDRIMRDGYLLNPRKAGTLTMRKPETGPPPTEAQPGARSVDEAV
jgi:hypothetical protein